MKKIILGLLVLLITAGLRVNAANIEILPTMQTRSNAQDRVWVGTFQLVWNDFMDKIVHSPVRFREGTPTIAAELNMQTFSTNDISEKSYYKYAGKITKNTKSTITTAIRKKFKEKSDILDQLNLTPQNERYLIYAMLKKDFLFENEFTKLGVMDFGNGQSAEYFGISKGSKKSVRDGVQVLFYNSESDCAVKLLTKNSDEVYLYKNGSNKPFNQIYSDMQKKSFLYSGNSKFSEDDFLTVPNISLKEETSFDELTNKRLMGSNIIIEQALETVQFDMDNKGVKLKSEAAMTVMTTSLDVSKNPRYFNFNDTFVIFLKEQGKSSPYFALRVNDISKFQK
jgi:hypothetical protein